MNKPEEERKEALVAFALPKNIQKLEDDLRKYRIEYDTWFRERFAETNSTRILFPAPVSVLPYFSFSKRTAETTPENQFLDRKKLMKPGPA